MGFFIESERFIKKYKFWEKNFPFYMPNGPICNFGETPYTSVDKPTPNIFMYI